MSNALGRHFASWRSFRDAPDVVTPETEAAMLLKAVATGICPDEHMQYCRESERALLRWCERHLARLLEVERAAKEDRKRLEEAEKDRRWLVDYAHKGPWATINDYREFDRIAASVGEKP